MADDYAGDASTTGTLAPGGTSSGTLDENDIDWFKINLTAGLLYQVSLGLASDFLHTNGVDIGLVDSNGLQVAGTGTTDKSFQFTPVNSGIYYATVLSRNFNGVGTGNYTLTAAPADDYTANTRTTGLVTIGVPTTGTLGPTNDTDWLAVNLSKDFNYGFTVTTAANFTGSTRMVVRDANGVIVAGDSALVGAVINDTYTPKTSGTYYLSLTSGTGDYTITSLGDDYSADASTTGTLTVGASKTGTLESKGDDDWFGVTLTAGATYQFSIAGFASLTSVSSLSVVLRNSAGSQLTEGSAGRPISFKPTATGTYYLDVSANNTTGSYQLSSSVIGGTTPSPTPTTPLGGSGGGTSTTLQPVYRFFDSKFGTHFYTSNADERNTIIATRPDLVNEGIGLSALGASTDPNVSAVYRFFDTVHGTQFLTSVSSERDTIMSSRSDLRFEGTSFYEYNTNVAGSAPVYRFFDSIYGTHFYTGNESERASIVATRPDLIAEGISFYSPQA